jgi:hypothetical protein
MISLSKVRSSRVGQIIRRHLNSNFSSQAMLQRPTSMLARYASSSSAMEPPSSLPNEESVPVSNGAVVKEDLSPLPFVRREDQKVEELKRRRLSDVSDRNLANSINILCIILTYLI